MEHDPSPPSPSSRTRPETGPGWSGWSSCRSCLRSGWAPATCCGGETLPPPRPRRPRSQVPENVKRYDIPTDGDPSIGPEDAKITIVEFSDYQCPYCKRWNDEVFDRLLQDYPDQVRIVYRDFPLTSIHPEAFRPPRRPIAPASRAPTGNTTGRSSARSMAWGRPRTRNTPLELGLDTNAFAQCQSENRYNGEITADVNFAAGLGISSTPTFFVNGIALVGAQPYDVFKQVIDLSWPGKIPNFEYGHSMKKFVAVAGNIGVGKSTLVNKLCQKLGWQPFYEPVAENPYLADFYSDMPAWSFHSQVFFLTHRLRSHYQLARHPDSAIQDRSVYEDAEIFAQNLYLRGFIHPRDYETYRELYETLVEFLPPPDLVIYLRSRVPTLMQRIASRGRDYERTISPGLSRPTSTSCTRNGSAVSCCAPCSPSLPTTWITWPTRGISISSPPRWRKN